MSGKSIDWETLRAELIGEESNSVLPSRIKLPMLPRALQEFMQRAQDPEAEPVELGKIISTDAGLSSELLRYANSAAFGARSTITSVQQALCRLGLRTSQMHLSTYGVRRAMKSTSSKLIHFETFWNTNLERALLARKVAKLLGANSDVAFTAAMLQDFLLPIITNQMLDDYLEFTEAREDFEDLSSFETQKFGWGHAEAGAQVMHGWSMPDSIVCCLALHHRGASLLADEKLGASAAAAVAVSSLIPDAIRQIADGMDELMGLHRNWEVFDLQVIAQEVDEEFRELCPNASSSFSLLQATQKAFERENMANAS